MESNVLTALFLPIAIGIIMLGMGLTLELKDFKRILVYPKAIAIGIVNQLIVLPLVGLLLVTLFSLPPELGVGIMILAACPGGPTSNLMSHVAKGDTALSITLTAIVSVITVITIPYIVNFSMQYLMGASTYQPLPVYETVIKIFLVTILPVIIGMIIHRYAPGLAHKSERVVRIASVVFLVLIIIGAVLKEKENVISFFIQAGPVALALNVITMAIGYASGLLFKLNKPQRISISIEVGIQNGTLAMAIAMGMLENAQMAIPPAIYSLIMFMTGGIFMYWAAKGIKKMKTEQKLA